MALGTLTKISNYVAGNRRVRVYDIQLTTGANYTTGGESLTPAMVNLRQISQAYPTGAARLATDGSTARSVSYDYTNNKLQVYTTASAEAAGNSDQSGFTVRMVFVGR